MIALDTNILVGLLVAEHPAHEAVMSRLRALNGPWATTSVVLGETLRLLTHPKVFPKPASLKRAVAALQGFIEQHEMELLDEPEDWWLTLGEMKVTGPGLQGNDVFDARIALTLRHHGVKRLWTRDAGFARFGFLSLVED